MYFFHLKFMYMGHCLKHNLFCGNTKGSYTKCFVSLFNASSDSYDVGDKYLSKSFMFMNLKLTFK